MLVYMFICIFIINFCYLFLHLCVCRPAFDLCFFSIPLMVDDVQTFCCYMQEWQGHKKKEKEKRKQYSSLVKTGNFSSYISKVKTSLHFLLFTVRDFWDWKSFVRMLLLSLSRVGVVFISWCRVHHEGLYSALQSDLSRRIYTLLL